MLSLVMDSQVVVALRTLAVQVKTEDGKDAASSLDMQEAPTAPDSHQEQAAAAHDFCEVTFSQSEVERKW